MSRYLAYISTADGDLFPVVPVLEELARRGHHVHVRTMPRHLDALRGCGLEASAIAPALDAAELDDWKERDPRKAIARSLAHFVGQAPGNAADLRDAVDHVRPDALIVETNAWGARSVAEAGDLPWAEIMPFPWPVHSDGVPPFGPGLKPMGGPIGRLRDRVLGRLIVSTFDRAGLDGLNRVRADVGLEPLSSVMESFGRADRVICATAEPFEYPRASWPEHMRFVGPLAWERSEDAEAPAWIDEIDRPLVLVNTSTQYQKDGDLARVALEALRDEDAFVVATVPSDEIGDVEIPANARVERFVPHAPILRRAAVAITHGGMGSTQKALAAGVPVVVVPFGRDQSEVARRAERAGAGVFLARRRLDPGRLRTAVREAMSLRAGAERVAAGYRAAGGAPAAADALEELLPEGAAQPAGASSHSRIEV
jgi:MGT family glycosyltransferase